MMFLTGNAAIARQPDELTVMGRLYHFSWFGSVSDRATDVAQKKAGPKPPLKNVEPRFDRPL